MVLAEGIRVVRRREPRRQPIAKISQLPVGDVDGRERFGVTARGGAYLAVEGLDLAVDLLDRVAAPCRWSRAARRSPTPGRESQSRKDRPPRRRTGDRPCIERASAKNGKSYRPPPARWPAIPPRL